MGEQVKLKTVLNNILNRDFKISDKQRNALIENVKTEASITEKLNINIHIYINWLEWALLQWQHEGPSKQALIFLIDITIELSKNKIIFVLLHQNNIFKQIIHVINTKYFIQDCDIFHSYIKFLDSFAHTEFGRNWLCVSFDCWKNVFEVIALRKYTEDLSIFMKDLFLNVMNCSKLFSIDLSELTLSPLTSMCCRIRQNNLQGVIEEDLNIELIPTIDFVSSTIMCISESVTLDNEWLNHCNNLLNLQKPLTTLLEIIEGEELTLEVSKLLISLSFLELKQYSKQPHKFINLFMDNAIKILDVNTTRRFINNITILSYHLQRFWLHICRLVKVEDLNLSFNAGMCICAYQTIALVGVSMNVQGEGAVTIAPNDEIREQLIWHFMKKIKKTMFEPMHRLINTLLKIQVLICEAHLSLDYLIKSIDLYDKECKKLCFNSLLYFVGDIIVDIHKTKSLVSIFYDCNLLTHFINCFVFFASRCDITWIEETSTMLVLDTVTDLLQVQDLPYDLIVAALKMLDLAINKHMAPNLMFLVDSNPMISNGPIGDILQSNLNCEDVEVRCAASKVLLTISESVKSKYPFFQKLILEFNVCQLLVEIIFSNEVVDVRANALKCLQHLVGIDVIWNVFGAIPEILVTLINSLKIETEILLRTEMVNLVTAIYEQDYFTEHQVKELYEIMTRLGLHDFDVAVRITTLKFWDAVIKKLLIDEGMIDNEFPEVTFSKNSKKIVILDENEIQRRLRRLMKKLSEIGCLTVLNSCFTSKEKSEKQCVDEIITNILTILEKYDIDENNVDLSSKIHKRIAVEEVLNPKDFLKNIIEVQENFNEDNTQNFILILDEILKYNNLDDLDSMDSYL